MKLKIKKLGTRKKKKGSKKQSKLNIEKWYNINDNKVFYHSW